MPIFRDRTDRQMFRTLLGEVSIRYDIEIHVECLMGNHYHLLVLSTEGRISEAMRDLNGRYARWFNRRHGRTGPLFGARFHSVVITSDEQLVATWCYIHHNPSGIGVRDLVGYEWSSAEAYLCPGLRPHWLHTGVLTRLIGETDMRRLLQTAPAALSCGQVPLERWGEHMGHRERARP